VVMYDMKLAHSRLTAQGQISVPAEVRKRLGIGPGSVIEWDATDGEIVVRRAGTHTFEDVHGAVFSKPPKARTVKELKEGIGKHMKQRHARG
jgi:antitoxin PrlF